MWESGGGGGGVSSDWILVFLSSISAYRVREVLNEGGLSPWVRWVSLRRYLLEFEVLRGKEEGLGDEGML